MLVECKANPKDAYGELELKGPETDQREQHQIIVYLQSTPGSEQQSSRAPNVPVRQDIMVRASNPHASQDEEQSDAVKSP